MQVKEPTKLRRRRKDKHFSQTQLAALVGCTQQYISLLESGRDDDCSEKVAERIAKYLDVDLEDYFAEREVVRTPPVATGPLATGHEGMATRPDGAGPRGAGRRRS